MATGATLRYGSYPHEGGECSIAIVRSALMENNISYGYNERWDIQGMFIGDGAELIQKMRALETAYSRNGQDLTFTLESGAIAHQLRSSATARGTVVVSRPSYTRQGRAELASYRNYSIAVEGQVESRESMLIYWAEALNWEGNGMADWGYLIPLRGEPISQLRTERTIVTVTQQGRAVGMNAYPLFNPPLWPANEIGSRRRVSMELPDLTSTLRQISWSYTFQFTSPPSEFPAKR